MGTNKRYGDSLDARTIKRLAEKDIRPRIQSLPPLIVNAEEDPPTKAAEPVPVTAWVPVSAGVVQIEATAEEWNRTAVRISWTENGVGCGAWVYLGAIKRR
ncbi:hypothetical protein N1027_15685 [Herbiconiux sp. CPCC 205763]|uniref:Uncharacterized protein n=1 Tax=Herbiconiux aconitum TaxID=2970913 RepID=A0ABT2GTM6_9MICO|nr:hypothetical protein [Herbiconiux aconitum]MCS5719576.1 hypothetical protein [Herbiconiux aconitum]